MTRTVVLDASAVVELLVGRGVASEWITEQIPDDVAAPAHLYAEVLSAVGRNVRAGRIGPADAENAIRRALSMRVMQHQLDGLVLGAWARRGSIRLADALYVELAAQLDTVVVTTDHRLARATPLAVAPPE